MDITIYDCCWGGTYLTFSQILYVLFDAHSQMSWNHLLFVLSGVTSTTI